jgi:hypothetical protein
MIHALLHGFEVRAISTLGNDHQRRWTNSLQSISAAGVSQYSSGHLAWFLASLA